MGFIPPFSIGTVISNAKLSEVFKVGNMGGMRRSKATNTLVLICDNTKGLYHDQWHDGQLHYTGMGKVGDQVLTGNQNKTLAESNINGVSVHLFEVNVPGKYTYSGQVRLAADPYQGIQPDDNGHNRKVWIFPLERVNEDEVISSIASHDDHHSIKTYMGIKRGDKGETWGKDSSQLDYDVSSIDSALFDDPVLLLEYLQDQDKQENESVSKQRDKHEIDSISNSAVCHDSLSHDDKKELPKKRNETPMKFKEVKEVPFSQFGMGYIIGYYNGEKPVFQLIRAFSVSFEKNGILSFSCDSNDPISCLKKQDGFTLIPVILKVEDGINYIGFSEGLDDPENHTIVPTCAEHVHAPYAPCSSFLVECECIEKQGLYHIHYAGRIVHISALDSLVDEDGYLSLGRGFGMKDFINMGSADSNR